MPRSGGIFTLIASYFATPGQTIRTEQHNPVLEDIATALTGSVARDGSSPMLGNLPMNGRKITNLGPATQASDAPRFDQVLPSSPYLNAVSGLTLAADRIPYATGPTTAAITPLTVFGRSLIDDANATAGRATLGAQAAGATLTSLEGLSLVAGDILYATGPDTLARLPKGTAGQVIAQNAGLTAPEWVNGFSKSYESSAQTITTSGALTLAHGLGVAPKLLTAKLVATTTNNGYSSGDVLEMGFSGRLDSTGRGMSVVSDATNIYIRFGDQTNVFSILNKSTGAGVLTLNTSWNLVMGAFA